jgi:hypothetical protein
VKVAKESAFPFDQEPISIPPTGRIEVARAKLKLELESPSGPPQIVTAGLIFLKQGGPAIMHSVHKRAKSTFREDHYMLIKDFSGYEKSPVSRHQGERAFPSVFPTRDPGALDS